MSDSRKEQRDKLRQTGCEAILPSSVISAVPVRPEIPCDPVPADPLPNIFTAPDGQTPVDPIAPSLDLIPIGNDAVTKTCADLTEKPGSVGDPQTIAADTILVNFSWYDVTPRLSTGQSIFLFTLYSDIPTLKAKLVSTAENAVSELAAYTNITTQQAKSANELALAIKTAATVQAEELALLQLVCGWYNLTQTVNCNTGALTTAEGIDLDITALNPSIIAAGEIFSLDSLADANSIALSLATSNLKCVYGNDQQTANCPGDVDADESIETVTKPVNTYFSVSSKLEANGLALSAAEAELECVWSNDAQTIACEPDSDDVAAIISGTLIYNSTTNELSDEYPDGVFPAGNVVLEQEGNNVTVASKLFTSTDSKADANSLAEDAGNSLLLCRWGNDVTKAQCPIVEIEDPNKTGLLDNSQIPPTTFKLKVLPNIELSQPASVTDISLIPNFFKGLSLDSRPVSLGSKSFTINPWDDPAILPQFSQNDLVSIKPLDETDSVIEGINLIGEITAVAAPLYNINVLRVIGDPLHVLSSPTWDNWVITLAQGSAVVANSTLSDISKEDANILAQGIVESTLRCIYCNVQVDPRCLPLQLQKNFDGELVEYDPDLIPEGTSATVWDLVQWDMEDGERVPTQLNLVWQVDEDGIPSVDEYGFRIPLYVGSTVVDPGLIKDPQFSWSDDSTLGVAAGKFCGESVPLVQEVSQNQLPVSFYKEKEDACVYCNEPVGADCVNGAVIRTVDPRDGSIFLPAGTVCLSSPPKDFLKSKYQIADSLEISGSTKTGTFASDSNLINFSFYGSPDFESIGIAVGDLLVLDGTIRSFPITELDQEGYTVTVTNPDGYEIPTSVVSVFVAKKLKGTIALVGADIICTVTNFGFNHGSYEYVLESDYVKVIDENENTFVIQELINPNQFKLLNLEANPLPSGEVTIELWHADTSNKPLAQQYATDSVLSLAKYLLDCFSLTVICSQQVVVECREKSPGFGIPASNLDQKNTIKVKLPRCFLSADSNESTVAQLTQEAREIALDMLDCQFFNNEVVRTCGTTTESPTAGQWVVQTGSRVPERTFFEDTFEKAQKNAIDLAYNLLEEGGCLFGNSEINVTCTKSTVNSGPGSGYTINNDLSGGCPESRLCAPMSVNIPAASIIAAVTVPRIEEGDPEPEVQVPDLTSQARTLGESIAREPCQLCGNQAFAKAPSAGCGATNVVIDFNQSIGANVICARGPSAADVIASNLATGHTGCGGLGNVDLTKYALASAIPPWGTLFASYIESAIKSVTVECEGDQPVLNFDSVQVLVPDFANQDPPPPEPEPE
jgi:hypothetical protein